MAIEDIIWAKNRHMFGGIEPNEVQDFSARVIVIDNDTNVIRMTVKLPNDTVVDGQTLCSVSGVIVRGGFDGYPEDEFSGIDFGDYSENGERDVEWDIDGRHTLYLSVFAYSDQGVINRNAKHVTLKLISGMRYHFGYDLDTTNPDPDARITYPDDVYNHGWVAADANGFSYWSAAMLFSPKPCVIDASGNVLHYLKESDYTKEDLWGETVQIDKTKHFVMMEWPKIYTKRWEDENGVYHFRCSDVKVEDDYECWCNYDSNGNEIDNFYTAVYLASSVDSYSTGSYSGGIIYTSLLADAKKKSANSPGWSIDQLVDHLLIQDLLVLITKTTDLASVFGPGRKIDKNHITGLYDQVGLFTLAKDNKDSIKIFGMEDYWSDGGAKQGTTRFIDDLETISDEYNYVKLATTVNDVDYVTERIYGVATGSSGPISKMQTFPWGRLPIENKGSTTTYECSGYDIQKGYSNTVGDSGFIFGYVGYENFNDQLCKFAHRLSFKPKAN